MKNNELPPIWRMYKLELCYGDERWRTEGFYLTEQEAVRASVKLVPAYEYRVTRGGMLIRRGAIDPKWGGA